MDNQTQQKTEKPKNEPKINGGARPGAGRKAGGENESTRERRMALQLWRSRVLEHVDELFNAQLLTARGLTYLMRIDKTKSENGKTKIEHVVVTDPEEMKQALDDNLTGGDDYYYLTTEAPDNRAIDSMMDRTFGKANESISLTGEDGKPLKIGLYNLTDDELNAAATIVKKLTDTGGDTSGTV